MKTWAAVALQAKRPLGVVEVDLEVPRAGEVPVEIEASGVCHADGSKQRADQRVPAAEHGPDRAERGMHQHHAAFAQAQRSEMVDKGAPPVPCRLVGHRPTSFRPG